MVYSVPSSVRRGATVLERVSKPHSGSRAHISTQTRGSASMYCNTSLRPPLRLATECAFLAIRKQVLRHALVALFAFLLILPVYAEEAPGGEPEVGAGTLPPGILDVTVYDEMDVPIIYPRETWEEWEHVGNGWVASDKLKDLLTWLPEPDNAPPDYSPVDRVIVHDQGCLNPTQCTKNATDFPVRTIQNIYRSHSVSRGWGDIGYNYIIDRQGRIYEGRYGGNGVRGAHTYVNRLCENLNVGSAGVLLLGDARAGPIPTVQSKSLGRLAAWLGVVNGFDASETTATTVTWRNPRNADNSCNLEEGSFSGVVTTGRLASHGDVEPGNSDKFSVAGEQQAAKNLYTEYSTYAYEREGDDVAYTILDGVAHEAPETMSIVAQMNKSQLLMFPKATVAALPNGSLVKSENRNRVYVIEAGERRPIPDADLFVTNGFDWDDIQYVSDRELALWRIGQPLIYPDGTLIRGEGTEEVYVFENGKLRHVTSAQLFRALKYSWDSIKVLFVGDVHAYTKGEAKRFLDGTLVRGQGPRVYLIADGKIRPIYSASVFIANNLDWGRINTLSDAELGLYPSGLPLPYPNGSLVRVDGGGRVFLLQDGYRRWIETADVLLDLGFGWGDIRIITTIELNATPSAQSIPTLAALDQKPVPTNEPEPEPEPEPVPQEPEQPTGEPIGEPEIRIGLALLGSNEHPSSVVKISYSVPARVLKNGTVIKTLAGDEETALSLSPKDVWRIESGSAGDIYSGVATINSYTNLGWGGVNDNRFRGVIELTFSTRGVAWLINELPMEDYLLGVAETVNGEEPEYAQAFAIASRSYALNHLEGGGKRPEEPFTLRRTSSDQLYKGYNYELRAPDPVAAVVLTQGQVATYGGAPIRSAYSSGAAGPTLDACDVFGGEFCTSAFDYLRGGVDDPAGTKYNLIYPGCGGANHCVGIDAAGGRRMAELGESEDTILKTYYPGIVIENRW